MSASCSFWVASSPSVKSCGIAPVLVTLKVTVSQTLINRKSIGEGKRVDLGCRRIIKKKDGIRDVAVTGVQTCALPICRLVAECEVVRDCPGIGDPEGHRLANPDKSEEHRGGEEGRSRVSPYH